MGASAVIEADLDLAARSASGEEDASRELFRRYQGRVQATLYRVFGSNRDMDDLLQEVFLQVFRSLPAFRGDAQLSTWIHRIAIRVAYRYLRKHQRDPLLAPEAEVAESASGPVRDLMAREGLRRFYAALGQLSPAARIAFVLFEIEGLSIAEVAGRVEAAHTTTKLRIWRARKALYKIARADPVLAEFLDHEPHGEQR
ncbi:MAG: sigma-70 family RNA polymerase sigma factor [Deltaproteobacteria bacterium]|nr:sigma-70 family RNA polymerase sigma factor [Deltaproteobacteria bacterium]